MIFYVLGLAFDERKNKIILVPQGEQLNGIRGKVAKSESAAVAINRITFLGTGMTLKWIHKGMIRGVTKDGVGFFCQVYYTNTDRIYKAKNVELYNVADIKKLNCVSNIPAIVEFLTLLAPPFIILEYGLSF